MISKFGAIAAQLKKANKVYLYKDGDECLDLTGGWTWTFGTIGGQSITKHPDRIELKFPQWSDGRLLTVNNIDRSGYDLVGFEWDWTAGSGGYITLEYNENEATKARFVWQGAITMPSPSIVRVSPTLNKVILYVSNTNTRSINIRKVWLESRSISKLVEILESYDTNPVGTSLISLGGTWSWLNGTLKQTNTSASDRFAIHRGMPVCSNLGSVEIEAEFKVVSDPSNARCTGLAIETLTGMSSFSGYSFISYVGKCVIYRYTNGVATQLASSPVINAMPLNTTHKIKAKVDFNTTLLELYYDGVLACSVSDKNFVSGRPGFTTYGCSAEIDNLVYKYT